MQSENFTLFAILFFSFFFSFFCVHPLFLLCELSGFFDMWEQRHGADFTLIMFHFIIFFLSFFLLKTHFFSRCQLRGGGVKDGPRLTSLFLATEVI